MTLTTRHAMRGSQDESLRHSCPRCGVPVVVMPVSTRCMAMDFHTVENGLNDTEFNPYWLS